MDHYVKIGNNNIHLAALLYNLMVIGILVLIVSAILATSLKRDLSKIELLNIQKKDRNEERRKNNISSSEDELSLTSQRAKPKVDAADVAWKKLQGDVFRKPDLPALLATLTGIGVQCGFMIYVFIAALIIGLFNPYFRYYNFVNAFFILTVGGYGNGYCTATMMKYFGASDWKLAASSSAFILPSSIVAVFVLVDFIEYFEKAT